VTPFLKSLRIAPTRSYKSIWFCAIWLFFGFSTAAIFGPESTVNPSQHKTEDAVAQLIGYLALPPANRPTLLEQSFFRTPLTTTEAVESIQLLAVGRVQQIRTERRKEMDQKRIVDGQLEMPFYLKSFGERPATG